MMAELNILSSGTYSKSGDTVTRQNTNAVVVAGVKRAAGVIAVATSETPVPLGEVTSVGFVYIENLDPTNYVRVGCPTGQYTNKFKPGEGYWFRASANTIYAIANSAPCNISYEVISD
jgi:hypothetical protein